MPKPKTLSQEGISYLSIDFDYYTTTGISELLYPYAESPDLFTNNFESFINL